MSENTPSVAEILGLGLDFFRNLPEGIRDLIVAEARHLFGEAASAILKAVIFQDGGPVAGVTTTDEARQRAHDLALEHARAAAARVAERHGGSLPYGSATLPGRVEPVDTDQARGLR